LFDNFRNKKEMESCSKEKKRRKRLLPRMRKEERERCPENVSKKLSISREKTNQTQPIATKNDNSKKENH